MRALRASLPDAGRVAADAAIARGVLGLSAYRAADVVLSYLSMRDEVETREIIRDAWEKKRWSPSHTAYLTRATCAGFAWIVSTVW